MLSSLAHLRFRYYYFSLLYFVIIVNILKHKLYLFLYVFSVSIVFPLLFFLDSLFVFVVFLVLTCGGL